jgi:hypothetical protein
MTAGAIRVPHFCGFVFRRSLRRSRRNCQPATRATRLKPRVKRPEARNPGPTMCEIAKPAKRPLDTASQGSELRQCVPEAGLRSPASAGSLFIPTFPRVPLRASRCFGARFTLGFRRVARIRGLASARQPPNGQTPAPATLARHPLSRTPAGRRNHAAGLFTERRNRRAER